MGNDDKGWIKTYRKLQDCWIWVDNEPFDKRSAWIDLLLTANHKDVKILFDGELTLVKRGQFVTSIRKLSEKWKWDKNKTLKFLKLLESDNMLKRESDNRRTLVTIVNYEIYQDGEDTNGTQTGHNRDSIGTQQGHKCATNKNDKNDKNEKNNNILCSTGSSESVQSDEEKNFEIIYNSYPKKVGKNKGYEYYRGWLRGRDISGRRIKLTNKQIWNAIAKYKHQLEENGTEKQYIKDFSTFMCKAILDYVEDDV